MINLLNINDHQLGDVYLLKCNELLDNCQAYAIRHDLGKHWDQLGCVVERVARHWLDCGSFEVFVQVRPAHEKRQLATLEPTASRAINNLPWTRVL